MSSSTCVFLAQPLYSIHFASHRCFLPLLVKKHQTGNRDLVFPRSNEPGPKQYTVEAFYIGSAEINHTLLKIDMKNSTNISRGMESG